MGFSNGCLGYWDKVRAVDHFVLILAECRDIDHILRESGPHVILVNVLLPIAGHAKISGDKIVGLKAHFMLKGIWHSSISLVRSMVYSSYK